MAVRNLGQVFDSLQHSVRNIVRQAVIQAPSVGRCASFGLDRVVRPVKFFATDVFGSLVSLEGTLFDQGDAFLVRQKVVEHDNPRLVASHAS